MVWIHGGGFIGGNGGTNFFGPDYFMSENNENPVILVTLNYRLGILGFLSLGDDVVTGNMGLKDQTLALKWVQKNIDNFGGDPNQVTIFGESAGGFYKGMGFIFLLRPDFWPCLFFIHNILSKVQKVSQ